MIRALAIIILLYLAVRFLSRIFMPSKSKANQQSRYNQAQPADNRKDGEVRIEYTDPEKAKRRKDSGEGEYVDFEELD
ncbi:DUF4834 family protein [Cryomorpha ignava]|uniref:DUF4834 family protein n=1 Tax=Cryomorpha ignava TaxID=101383 RepID=A0A7K3WPP1_9FLAO|nr:DUF4834 family protein [Cryomorpha ignava]NEN22725.1 DUF4834 family protein [Cryomorpha ignava]